MPNWVVMAIFAVVLFAIAGQAKGIFKPIALFFGLILGFFALAGAVATWWVWLLAIIAAGLYVGYFFVKRRAKQKKQTEEGKNGGNIITFFLGDRSH